MTHPSILPITVRPARLQDAEQLVDIYRPYVLNTAITFEYEVPTPDQFRNRMNIIMQKYPYLVAEMPDSSIAGYAYASPFKERAAYDWAVELSIYISHEHQREHIGQALYEALEQCLKTQHVTNLNACITFIEQPTLHRNGDSIRFHEQLGFTTVAHFHKCGYKFGRWWDMIWMEKIIAAHETPHPDFIPFKPFL